MAFENANRDLILGDPNGARIELLANEAKIVLYNEFDTPIMEFDGTAVFEGDTFSAFQIRNKEGEPKLQLDQFQCAIQSAPAYGTRIRIYPGEQPLQPPALEIEPPPIAGVRQVQGSVFGTTDEVNNGAALQFQSPTPPGNTAALMRLTAESNVAGPRLTLEGTDFRTTGTMFVPGTFAKKTLEPENRTITFFSDPGLQIEVPAPGEYALSGFLAYRTTGTADFKIRFRHDGGWVNNELRWCHTGPNITGGGAGDFGMYFNDTAVPLEGSPSGAFRAFHVTGTANFGTTGFAAGQFFGFEWAQNTLDAASSTLMLRRSWLRLDRIS